MRRPRNVLHRAHALDDVARAPPRCTAAAAGHACCGRRHRSSTGGRRSTRLDARGERLHLAQVLPIQRRRCADRQRYAVHHHRVALTDAHQVVAAACRRGPGSSRSAPRTSRPAGRRPGSLRSDRPAVPRPNPRAGYVSTADGKRRAGLSVHPARESIRTYGLGLRSVALRLGHLHESLALAGILTLAGVVGALAGRLALAGVHSFDTSLSHHLALAVVTATVENMTAAAAARATLESLLGFIRQSP